MSTWLKSPKLCGCYFAASVARRLAPSVYFEPLTAELVDAMNASFEVAAEKKQFALAIFPYIAQEHQLAELLITMLKDSRWQCNLLDSDETHGLLELQWQTSSGAWSNAVGFATFPTMPLTRRAPFASLGVWPGGHDNPFLRNPKDVIGLADSAHTLDQAQYKKRMSETLSHNKKIRELFGSPALLTQSTFRLTRVASQAVLGA